MIDYETRHNEVSNTIEQIFPENVKLIINKNTGVGLLYKSDTKRKEYKNMTIQSWEDAIKDAKRLSEQKEPFYINSLT